MPFLPSAYLDTVTMILKSRERDRPYSATGFFFRHCVGGEREAERLYLVTSASALGTELETVGLICRRSRGIGCKAYPATGKHGLGRGRWLRDPETGLAALPVDRERLAADAIRYKAFSAGNVLVRPAMANRGIGEGDDVLVLGLTPERHRFVPTPMVRRGIVSSIRDCYRDHAPTFLVEATLLPRNNGSPVVTVLERGGDGPGATDPDIRLIGAVSEPLPNPGPPVSLGTVEGELLIRVNTGLVRVCPVDTIVRLAQQANPLNGP